MKNITDHYHQQRLREKRNDRLLGIVTIIVLSLAVGLVIVEVVE